MKQKTYKIALIGLFSALAYISFTFLQIKIPTPGGFTSFHLGNTFCVLAALILGGLPGGIAGAIGMGIGDILDPIYVTVAPKTIVLKLMMGIITGYVAHRYFHIESLKGRQLLKAVIISISMGMLCNMLLEPIVSYFYTAYLLGAPEKAAKALAGWNAITTSINAIMSIIIASTLYIQIYPRIKRLINK